MSGPMSVNIGLLILRVGIGAAFMFYGIPKLIGGPGEWAGLGQAMGSLGISFAPAFWGFMAAISMALGGLLLIIGLMVRPAAAFMCATMLVATLMHLRVGDPATNTLHAAEMALVFLALVFTGAGRYHLPCPLCSGSSAAGASASAER
ncbi:MAG: DoxX family protein [Planctomycetota bacterium]